MPGLRGRNGGVPTPVLLYISFIIITLIAAGAYVGTRPAEDEEEEEVPGEVHSLTITIVSPVTAEQSSSITVYAHDAENNPVSGADISLSYTIPGRRDPWRVSLRLVDQGDGTYTSSLTSQWAGTYNITAEVVGTAITASGSVSFIPGQVAEVVITSTSPREAEPENTATVSFYFTDASGNVIPSGQIEPGVITSFGELGQVITYPDDTFSVTLSSENLGTAEVTITENNSGASGSENVVFSSVYIGVTADITPPGILILNYENFEIQVENFEIQRFHARVNVFVPENAGQLDNYEITIEYDNNIFYYISTSDGDLTDNFLAPIVEATDNIIKISQAGSSPGPSTDVAILTFGPVNFGYGGVAIVEAHLYGDEHIVPPVLPPERIPDGGKVLKRLIVPLKIWIVDGSGVTEEDAIADAQRAEDKFNKNAEACRSQYRHVYIVEINHISESEWDIKVPDSDIEGTEGVPGEEEDNQRKNLISQNTWERWVNVYYVPDSSFVGMGWHTDNVIFIKDNDDFDNRTLFHELVHEFSRSAVKDSPADNAAAQGARTPGNIMNYDNTGDNITSTQGGLIDSEIDKRAEERPEEEGGGFIYKPTPYVVEPTLGRVHVGGIETDFMFFEGNPYSTAPVTIEDAEGNPVAGATVTVEVDRPDGTTEAEAATTGSDGVADITHYADVHGTYTFTVTDVQVEGMQYDSAANVVSNASVTLEEEVPSTAVVEASISVAEDPAGHALYIGMPGTLNLTVTANSTITIAGLDPWVYITGIWEADLSFTATGSGTVAGYPNIVVTYEGAYISYTSLGQAAVLLFGDLTMGAEGGLPGALPITYRVEGQGSID